MPFTPDRRSLSFSIALFFLFFPFGGAQAPRPPEARPPAPLPMEQEHHHQLVFANSYVKAFYVEIPAHDSTLYHRHDLPYVSLPPPPAPAATAPAEAVEGPRVSYNPGGFSHAVTNSTDVALRNVAIDLLRPQGAARNRCAEVVGGQPLNNCDKPTSPQSVPYHYTLFETDEIVVEYLVLPPHSTFTFNPDLDTLVGGLSGVSTNAPEGVRAKGAFFEPRSGLAWLPTGSTAIFETVSEAAGHCIAIKFKDQTPLP